MFDVEQSFVVTAYCPCKICTGKDVNDKNYRITASGRVVRYGYVACNWLPFGTKISIERLGEFIVMDRGDRLRFGDINNRIRHIDIYLSTHELAKRFGTQKRIVKYKSKGE